jgi:hypothetical protein
MDAIDQNLARIRHSVDSAIRRRSGVVPGDDMEAPSQPSTPAQPSAEAFVLSPKPEIEQASRIPRPDEAIPEDASSRLSDLPPTDLAVEPVPLHRRIWAWIKRVVPITHRPKDHAD